MRAIADGIKLYRPPLPANNIALAVEVNKLIAREVAATITGGLQRARGHNKAASSNCGRQLQKPSISS